MARFEGITESIVYRNDTNGWTVATIKLDSPGRVTAVGVMPFLSQGTNVVLEGEWTNHPEYGKRISVTSYEVTRPQTESAIEKYLGSGAIRGIKSSMAKRIVKHFGEETLDVMEAHPERLIEVSGIGPKTMRMIAASFREQNEARGTMMFLQSYGLSLKAAMRVQRAYGDMTERVVRSNPYRLSDEIDGIGFQTADGIARALGFGETSDFRLSSGIRYCLSEAVNGSGHMFLPREALLDKAAEVLNVTQELCEKCLNAQIVKGDLIAEDVNGYHAVYLPKLYRAEKRAAELLLRHRETIRPRRNASTLAKEIERYEKREGVSLCEAQRRAVICAAKDGMAIVTGGPGTGKTTSINCIIRLLDGENIALCAPTGRAAKRMSEATGMEARTIHRLLEYAGEDGFQRDEENPIEADYVIVDEVSMIDIFLFTALLRALRPGTGLILVGDADQLPSVGAGNVLRDLIAAEAVPVVCLTEIFRQAQESMIVVNAHRINHGEMPVIRVKDTDFFLEKRETIDDCMRSVISLVSKRIPDYFGLDALRGIQVMTPMKKGDLGVWAFNRALQEVLNPSEYDKTELKHGDTVFREGDKVMQIHNDYDLEWEQRGVSGTGVFNGDIGYIESVDTEDTEVTVVFDDGRRAEYDSAKLDSLELAYCMSVHKSQGSEFDAVVLPLFGGPPMLLTRNLLYTAITRAKKLVVIVGRESCIQRMVANDHISLRFSGLEMRLREGVS